MSGANERVETGVGADICLIVEGGYPYVLGGVASWADALIRAVATARPFTSISITISSQPRRRAYVLPDNAVGVTDVILDACPRGRPPRRRDAETDPDRSSDSSEKALTCGDGAAFEALIARVARDRLRAGGAARFQGGLARDGAGL